MNNKPTIVFFGTPHFAVQTLEALEAAQLLPDIVITAPDKPAGRGLLLKPSPVKEWAEDREIPVLEPESLKKDSETLDLLYNSEWDLFIVSAYGKILPKAIIDLPAHGTLNVHPSLLPRFRGASPIESQILENEQNTGVTIMLMDEELDHGPVLAQASVTPEEWPLTAPLLDELLGHVGGELLTETIPTWIAGEITPEAQNHDKATYTRKIEKADGEIDLTDDGYQNYLKYCAYSGWPGTFFRHIKNDGDMIRVKITDATFEDGAFIPRLVVPEGKKETEYTTFLNNVGSSA
ncbi:MAG: methionyl-tRNA formyltransferase [Patescibacteria group bacterium UBA2163]